MWKRRRVHIWVGEKFGILLIFKMNAPRSIFGSLGTSLFGTPAPPAPAPTTAPTQPKNTSITKPTTTSRTLPAQPTNNVSVTGTKPGASSSGQHAGPVDIGVTSQKVSHI